MVYCPVCRTSPKLLNIIYSENARTRLLLFRLLLFTLPSLQLSIQQLRLSLLSTPYTSTILFVTVPLCFQEMSVGSLIQIIKNTPDEVVTAPVPVKPILTLSLPMKSCSSIPSLDARCLQPFRLACPDILPLELARRHKAE